MLAVLRAILMPPKIKASIHMTETKLADRRLPNHAKGEDFFNMVSHIVEAVLYEIGKKTPLRTFIFSSFCRFGKCVTILVHSVVHYLILHKKACRQNIDTLFLFI